MIRLTHVRTAQSIPAGFRGAKRIQRTEELVAAFQAGAFDFQSTVWKAAKKQLKKESAGKCAYCEAPTSAVAHGDVEHFRPKSVYWWLSYCYENYTYSCQICNQTFKGDRFPVHGPAMRAGDLTIAAKLNPDPVQEAEGMAYADFETRCAGELAHLPDVYREDPEALFKWEADPVRKAVKLLARTQSARHQRAATAAETVLGLNREELSALRWTLYADLEIYRDVLAKLPHEDTLAIKVRSRVKAMMADSGEFAGMVRYFVRDEWGLSL
jgi:uncharacterized protein (TIGR02646 family)